MALSDRLTSEFDSATTLILECAGKVVVSGVGKSGHIARKIASTLASTGTLAIFVHPSEASHGDLGMISPRDVVLAISKSGESPELDAIVQYCRRFRVTLIAITADSHSTLGRAASCVLSLPNLPEVCPLGLAPTTSTSMTLALGDALAVVCMRAREFQPQQFRDYHPGGKLGQKLTRVRDIMHVGADVPLVQIDTPLRDAVLVMTEKRLGCVGVVHEDHTLAGIFTDGDLRRHIDQVELGVLMKIVMTPDPQRVPPDVLIVDVAQLFTTHRIASVFVCEDECPVGIVHVHDLLQKGLL